MKKKLLIVILAMIAIIILFLKLFPGSRSTNMQCRITDVPFYVDGKEAGKLAVMSGNYGAKPEYMPKISKDGDLYGSASENILTLNFHPRTRYKSSRGWGRWADSQHWAYIGISYIYQDESLPGIPRCGMQKSIKLPEGRSLHLKLSVKASVSSEKEHLLNGPIRIGGNLADWPDHVGAKNMVEIDNVPNIGRSLNDAECHTFTQDWGASYANFQYGDWILKNNQWTEVDINLNQIASFAKEKCEEFQGTDDVYLLEFIIGSEFKAGEGELTIQVKDFEIYSEALS